jgi:fatty acid desaturase
VSEEERRRLSATAVWAFGGGMCWGTLTIGWGWTWSGLIGAALLVAGMLMEHRNMRRAK